METARIKSRYRTTEKNVFVVGSKLSLLKTKAIMGANASGKSNLIRAIGRMVHILTDSFKDESTLEKNIIPFSLHADFIVKPSYFQLIFILDGFMYRYGFEATQEVVISEWLFGRPLEAEKNVRERYFFTREGMELKVNEEWFKEGKRLIPSRNEPPLFRDNSLALGVSAALNGDLSKKLMRYFHEQIVIVNGLKNNTGIREATLQLSDASFLEKVTELLQGIDPSITMLEQVEGEGIEEYSDEEKIGKHVVVHREIQNGREKTIPFLMARQEAEGTKKLFGLSAYLFRVLKEGLTLVVDEFDARMHPNLTRKIIEIFHHPTSNPKGAQLIFVSHDSNLLDAKLLRRDQITFADKSKEGATELYSLVEFKGVRNDASFEKDYLGGKYYAVPNNLNVLEEAAVGYIYGSED